MTTRRGWTTLTVLGSLAVAVIVLELALGAVSFGEPHLADPCTATPVRTGSGVSAVVERFARATLDGAACKLRTTREELVLSFVPAAGTTRIRWDRRTVDRALRAGLDRAAHDVAGNGIAGGLLAFTLGKLFAPSVEWFLQQVR
ncbi:MAG: hypothetical protein ACJ780_04315 [Solirubrobacteraceae bacterium]